MTKNASTRFVALLAGVGAAVCLGGLHYLLVSMTWHAPESASLEMAASLGSMFSFMAVLLLSVGCVVVVLLGMPALLFRATRPYAGIAMAVATGAVGPMWYALESGSAIQRVAEEAAITRGTLLVRAIREYEREHGVPPVTLAALVPKHLDGIPPTGVPWFPNYGYTVDPIERGEARRWRITVQVAKMPYEYLCLDSTGNCGVPGTPRSDGWLRISP